MKTFMSIQGTPIKRLALAVGAACLSGATAAAAQGTAGNLTEAAQRAINTNPEVQASWHAFQAAIDEVGVARGNYFPSVDLVGGIGREEREFDGRGSFSSDFAEISLTQMIYDGFATPNAVEQLDRAKLVRYYELLGASEEVALEATRAYLDVQRFRDLVVIAQDNYVAHLEVFNQIEDRVRTGAGRGADLEQISGRLSLAESNLITEASNLHDVSARYLRIIGELPAERLAPAPALDERVPPSVAEAVRMAYEGNPGFHAAIENIAASRAEHQGTRAAFLPRVDFRARHGANNLDDIAGRRDHTVVEVVASINLFNGGSDLAEFRRTSDLLEQSMDLRDQECINVRQTTQIAYNDTRRIREQLEFLNQHRQSIDRVRGAYQQQFDIGQRTLLDVLDSENEYFEASRAYVNAEYDLALAHARTLAAMGSLLPALGITREGLPTPADLGSDGVSPSPEDICPDMAPTSYSLDDLVAGMNVPAPTRAPDITLSADTLFAINSAELSPAARGELDRLAEQIRGRDDLRRVFIAGHADITGSDAINDPLSQRRADSVAGYLASQGVSAGLMETRGYGSRQPVASNATVEGRRANRRVEITLERLDE